MKLFLSFSLPQRRYFSKVQWGLIFIIAIITAIPWSLKTSGVLEMTTDWGGYPWGYKYIVHNYDDWPMNKENTFYINQHQAFQGIEGSYVARNSGFELHRSLYAALSTGLWFLGPLLSLWIMNLFFWGLAVYSMVYAVAQLGGSKFEQCAAAVLVLFGQGFIYSVGEFSPHVVGYGSMYYIYAFAAYHRIWDKETKWQNYGQVYALIGLLQMTYNAAWLSLPAIGMLSLYRIFHTPNRVKEFLSLCGVGLMAVIPYLTMLISTSILVSATGIISYSGNSSFFPFIPFLKKYLPIYIEGLLGVSPFFIIFSCIAFIYGLLRKNMMVLSLVFIGILQTAICGFFMLTASGRGYVTFTCSATFVLLSVYALSELWNNRAMYIKYFVSVSLICVALFSHLPKLTSNRLPLMGFCYGYLHHFHHTKWKKYDVHIIP